MINGAEEFKDDTREKLRRKRSSNPITKEFLQAQYELQNGLCCWCLQPNQKLTIDHLHPKSRGGEDLPYNIVLACQFCNTSKSNRFVLYEWLPPYLLQEFFEAHPIKKRRKPKHIFLKKSMPPQQRVASMDSVIDDETAERLVRIFSPLSDSIRLRIIFLLSHGEFCTKDIAKFIDSSESNTSHVLATLRDMDVVTGKKVGRKVVYRLTNPIFADILSLRISQLDMNRAK